METTIDNAVFSIEETTTLGSTYFNAYLRQEGAEYPCAWLNGKLTEDEELIVHIFDYNPALRCYPAVPRNEITHRLAKHYKKAWVTWALPKIAMSEVDTFAIHHTVKDWENFELPNLWIVEGVTLDFYHLGATEDFVYKPTSWTEKSPLNASKKMYSIMSGFKHPQYEGRLILRNLHGHALRYVEEASMEVHGTGYIDTNTPVDSFGLLSHLDLKTIEHIADGVRMSFPKNWTEKQKRILSSVEAAIGSAGVRHGSTERALTLDIDGSSLYAVINETGEFPVQDQFSRVLEEFSGTQK